jgi:hypothetical protein
MPDRPPVSGKFDALMRKLIKVPLEDVGTPAEFTEACNRAADNLMITTAELRRIEKGPPAPDEQATFENVSAK